MKECARCSWRVVKKANAARSRKVLVRHCRKVCAGRNVRVSHAFANHSCGFVHAYTVRDLDFSVVLSTYSNQMYRYHTQGTSTCTTFLKRLIIIWSISNSTFFTFMFLCTVQFHCSRLRFPIPIHLTPRPSH